MAGWKLKYGELKDENANESRYWSLFNFVFSNSSKKRNTYKFGLIKSILDNLFNVIETYKGVYISYYGLFGKFTENYWNLVIKYHLHQMRKDTKSEFSRIEIILNEEVRKNVILENLEFESIEIEQKKLIIKRVASECKRCVIGALYEDFDGMLYSFALSDDGIYLSYKAYEFLMKYKIELENLNYYAWAKFLEKINSDEVLIKVIDKLELSTPKRNNLAIYRDILRKEFQECNCFYCGKQLKQAIHVDHLIPWSFVKDDKIWNFVLACPSCNKKKNNRVPEWKYVTWLEKQNKKIQLLDNEIVKIDFKTYSDELLERMWKYAKMSGVKEYTYTFTCKGNV